MAAYLSAQIEAGAQAVQIFDTWGGILAQEEFEEFSLRYIKQVLSLVKTNGAPVIVFCKDCGHSLEKIADTGRGLSWESTGPSTSAKRERWWEAMLLCREISTRPCCIRLRRGLKKECSKY